MKVSIAMTTYNGARFLQEQLDSIISQTRLPDEMVICDDHSCDETVDTLRKFVDFAPFPVRLIVNKENIGLVGNFSQAIDHCVGDLIFLSDQDDIWLPVKIAEIEKIFENEPDVLMTLNDAELVDSRGLSYGLTKMTQQKSSGKKLSSLVIGCCTCFRGDFKSILLPIPENPTGHDEWINFVFSQIGGRKYCENILQKYRRHDSNLSNGLSSSTRKNSFISYFLMRIKQKKQLDVDSAVSNFEMYCDLLGNRLHVAANEATAESKLEQPYIWETARRRCEAFGLALKSRIAIRKLPRYKRPPVLINLWRSGTYNYFSGWKSVMADCILK